MKVEGDTGKMRLGSVYTFVVLADFLKELGCHYLPPTVKTRSVEVPAIAVGLWCDCAKLVTSVLEALIVFEGEYLLDKRHINFETFFGLYPLILTQIRRWKPSIIIILKDLLTVHLWLTFVFKRIVLRVYCVVLLGLRLL